MSGWIQDDFAKIGRATELQIASRRPDGSLRPFVTIWVVRAGDDIYVRSAHGYDNGWFQRALHSDGGRIKAGGVERDVRFEQAGADVADAVTTSYRAKYDRYGPAIVATVVSAESLRSTLRVIPT
jgi:hypothetical protein